MKTEEKVITFPQAKKIAELVKEKGIELPESECYWRSERKNEYHPQLVIVDCLEEGDKYYPAYDTSEMMEIMREFFETAWKINIHRFDKKWYIYLGEEEYEEYDFQTDINKNTLAEALGELLIYLIENDKL